MTQDGEMVQHTGFSEGKSKIPYGLDFLAGGGVMGARMRAYDWASRSTSCTIHIQTLRWPL